MLDMKYVGKTNIVPLMAEPSEQFKVILSDELKYPKGASFCFDGFNGVNDKDRLVSHIIDSAKKDDGTQLVPGRYLNTPKQKKYVICYSALFYYNFINVTLMKSPFRNLFKFNSGMLFKVYICCIRHRITRATMRNFTKDSVQQPGTYVHQAHPSSCKQTCKRTQSCCNKETCSW